MCFILVIVAALAWHHAVKFHLDKYIKYNDGSPLYYIGYAVAATFLLLALKNITN